MDSNLGYLRESLSNHIDNHKICQRIYEKLEKNQYKNEDEFVRDLEDNEATILNLVLQYELDYARNEQDNERVEQLNGVYELLLI
ncbi:sigma-G-dependent sporulation-specific acid-soluble spore protein CsgA [Alkalihalobacillus sp. MEB130]|uniref:sporulation protein n=1 Tax=Alkalihalobacillus sp. MEB130 TaxID=2976704 RepID=UPI0028DF91E8|nr:sporulation protein [Alkalihalobacillus sp. MEB130]MDT8860667.1 sigma-G-dependent sporulation-specific acid-soluble spore protein CsgA [Alkalihalobacillus sp. MEB130]